MEGNGENVTTVAQKSYAEMVLDSVGSALDGVRKAVEHYEEQRRDLIQRHEEALGIVDAHLALLRGALPSSVAPTPPPKSPTSAEPAWQRAVMLLEANGPLSVKEIGARLGVARTTAHSAIRQRPDKFVTYVSDGLQTARLKK